MHAARVLYTYHVSEGDYVNLLDMVRAGLPGLVLLKEDHHAHPDIRRAVSTVRLLS